MIKIIVSCAYTEYVMTALHNSSTLHEINENVIVLENANENSTVASTES